MKNNEISIHLQKGRLSVAGSLYQYDYGQRLIINGVDLPETYEVHFSNEQHGSSKTVLGDSTGVAIPDEYLTSGNKIHVWIYLHDGDKDGETEYYGIINVIRRAKPTDQEPTPVQQDVITQAIAALNSGVSTVESIAGEVQEIADGIPQTINAALQEAKDSGEFDGPKGDKGDKGDKGETGATGATGPKGDTGEQGPQGPQGEQGIQGEKGDKGDTGAQGPQGDKGDKGDTGEQGPKGDKGDPGEVTQAEFDSLSDAVKDKADTIVSSASGAIASFPDGAEAPVKSLTVGIEPVQEGTGDPSPDNVRPISGWTGAKVTRTGKNLFETKNEGRTYNGVTYALQADGKIALIGTANNTSFLHAAPSANMLTYIPAGTYTLSGAVSSNIRLVATTYEVSGNTVNKIADIATDNGAGAQFSLAVASWLGINIRVQSGQTTDVSIGIQIELGSTATAYEPYQGETYDITFPSEAGTVYGGTLDVTNGVLTVDRAMGNTIPGGSWTMETTANGNVFSRSAILEKALNYNFICNKYKNSYTYRSNLVNGEIGCYNNTNGRNRFSICDNRFSTVEDFLASLSDIEIVYELATPITYHLTPQEITTLLGQNNIWADTGDMTVTYRADTKLYIDKKFTELQALILEK